MFQTTNQLVIDPIYTLIWWWMTILYLHSPSAEACQAASSPQSKFTSWVHKKMTYCGWLRNTARGDRSVVLIPLVGTVQAGAGLLHFSSIHNHSQYFELLDGWETLSSFLAPHWIGNMNSPSSLAPSWPLDSESMKISKAQTQLFQCPPPPGQHESHMTQPAETRMVLLGAIPGWDISAPGIGNDTSPSGPSSLW